MQVIDVTIPLSETTPVWEGEQGVRIERSATIGNESDYNVSRIELGVHSGTHIDAPFHVLEGGGTLETIPLEKLTGPVQVVQIPDGTRIIDKEVLSQLPINSEVKKIVFKTSNSNFWDQDPPTFRRDFVGLDTSAAKELAMMQLDLIGIDFFSVSAFTDLHEPHKVLLNKGVVLLENLDLRAIDAGMYTIYCLPLKLIGTDGAPARVVLVRD